jgi:hypothetical protein
MSLEKNKKLAVNLMKAISAGDLERAAALMTDDVRWWSAGTTVASGSRTRQQVMDLAAGVFSLAEGPLVFTFGDVVAEGDRVVVEATSRMNLKSGIVYANQYLVLFRMRDGKISEVREYMDTEYFSSVFPRPC